MSSGKRSREASLSISDPFEQLETVWSSLESWFDLLMMEVEKLQDVSSAHEDSVDSKQEGSCDDEDIARKKEEEEEEEKKAVVIKVDAVQIEKQVDAKQTSTSIGKLDSPSRKPHLALPTVQSSLLAAAIVQSAPIERRTAFLKTSSSFDQTSPLSSEQEDGESKRNGPAWRDKRRSWHMERFTTRYLASGGSLSSIPALQRSLSTEANHGECRLVNV